MISRSPDTKLESPLPRLVGIGTFTCASATRSAMPTRHSGPVIDVPGPDWGLDVEPDWLFFFDKTGDSIKL